MQHKYAIYGCGGFGREVLPLLRLDNGSDKDNSIVFVSDSIKEISSVINGVNVISFHEYIELYKDHRLSIAVGDAKQRQHIAEKCKVAGLKATSVFANTARILDSVTVGEGAVFCDFTMATSNIIIGKHFHANIYSYVAHDCIIGDFVTLAPRVCINGNTIVEDDVYIGTGAVLKQGSLDKPLRIGRGALIGMGAVVTKDVPPGVIVVGNPARVSMTRKGYEAELLNLSGF